MHESAEQLNAATRELAAASTQSARLQTMALAIATELVCTHEEMLSIRASILNGSPKLISKKLQRCLFIAGRWNEAFERGELDILSSIRSDIGLNSEPGEMQAFERAASKIQPIRP